MLGSKWTGGNEKRLCYGETGGKGERGVSVDSNLVSLLFFVIPFSLLTGLIPSAVSSCFSQFSAQMCTFSLTTHSYVAPAYPMLILTHPISSPHYQLLLQLLARPLWECNVGRGAAYRPSCGGHGLSADQHLLHAADASCARRGGSSRQTKVNSWRLSARREMNDFRTYNQHLLIFHCALVIQIQSRLRSTLSLF